MPHITVFTPVYNRAHTLSRLYNSLKKQTYRDFEWVIVDDGSSDDSVKIINDFIANETTFNIILFQNKHGGKHRAVNRGLDIASGDLFFMLDSDDWLIETALERVVYWEKKIPTNRKCAGLCGVMIDPKGNIVSKGLKKTIFMPLTTMIKKNITGDHADILYTKVFKEYKYPEIEGEMHIAPGVPFIRMANDGFNLLFFNEPIYIADYGPDGLTAMGDKKIINNFRGYTLRTVELLSADVGLKRKIYALIKYSYICKTMNINLRKEIKLLNISGALLLLFYIAGVLLYYIKK